MQPMQRASSCSAFRPTDTGMADSENAPLIWLIAGEPSGDLIGARLIAALRERTDGRLRIAGIGGEAMAAEGFR